MVCRNVEDTLKDDSASEGTSRAIFGDCHMFCLHQRKQKVSVDASPITEDKTHLWRTYVIYVPATKVTRKVKSISERFRRRQDLHLREGPQMQDWHLRHLSFRSVGPPKDVFCSWIGKSSSS